MTDGIKRIAMWSGPRNISTAMMRSFENRPDTVVMDEPLYAYYLYKTGLDHPGRELILDSQPTDAVRAVESLFAPINTGETIVYQKHMTHHLLEGIDLAALDGLTHVFLIRDPRAMVASYVKSREQVTLADLGITQMGDLFKRTSDRLGYAPPVIHSKDILMQPEKGLRALCAAVNIPFTKAMLSWPAGKRDTDGVWAPWWYKSVEASTGFIPYHEKEISLPSDLQKIADECMDVYTMMCEQRLKIS